MRPFIVLAMIVLVAPFACRAPSPQYLVASDPTVEDEAPLPTVPRPRVKRGQLAVWYRNDDTGGQWTAANDKARRLGSPRNP